MKTCSATLAKSSGSALQTTTPRVHEQVEVIGPDRVVPPLPAGAQANATAAMVKGVKALDNAVAGGPSGGRGR